MKYLTLLIVPIFLTACTGGGFILTKASIQKQPNKYYVEIEAGGFTSEKAVVNELNNFSKSFCASSQYKITKKRFSNPTRSKVPGIYCTTNACQNPVLLQASVECMSSKPPLLNVTGKHNIILPLTDSAKFKSLYSSDDVMQGVYEVYGIPDKVLIKNAKEIYWQYYSKNRFIIFKRESRLLGTQTNHMNIAIGKIL